MRMVKRLFKNPLSLMGIILVLFFTAVAIGAPWLAPPDRADRPYQVPRDGFRAEPVPPTADHPFGTTEGQYDVYYGVVWGTRTAFKVGLIVTGATLIIGLTLGMISGYYGGMIDEIIMRIVEVFMAFPFLLAAITMAAVLQPTLGRSLAVGMLALIAFGWTGYARLIRGDFLAARDREYVLAARVIGASDSRIILRHLMPNTIFPTLVVASMDIGSYVLTFAALSFLGLGVDAGYADWGQMINYARNWIPVLGKYWHTVVFPGAAIVLFVLGWNLIGDAFRDLLDPRLRGTRAG